MPPALEERKVVSVLFSDLVDSTDRADRRDPEDVRATLVPFYRLLREELERFGGTVEKFIRRRRHGALRRAGGPRG
jgi:class 3 adenylate cyclase